MSVPAPRPGVDVDLDELIRLRLRAARLRVDALRRRRRGVTAGASRFRGRGMEYAESRAYLPGDDVRHMDWKVMARSAEPYTKVFQEERERPVCIVVDLAPGMFFGTRGCFKSVLAAQAAALLAWSAQARGDRVGGLIAGPRGGHLELEPAAGRRGVLRLLQALARLGRCPDAPEADAAAGRGLAGALERARRVLRPGALVAVISDFGDGPGRDPAAGGDAARHLHRLRAHDDLLLVAVADVLEIAPPRPGRYPIARAGRGGAVDAALVDVADARVRGAWQVFHAARRERLADLSRALPAPLVELITGADPVPALLGRLAAG